MKDEFVLQLTLALLPNVTVHAVVSGPEQLNTIPLVIPV
jgi:hypothetical protein